MTKIRDTPVEVLYEGMVNRIPLAETKANFRRIIEETIYMDNLLVWCRNLYSM
jgi:hypothetical protein